MVTSDRQLRLRVWKVTIVGGTSAALYRFPTSVEIRVEICSQPGPSPSWRSTKGMNTEAADPNTWSSD